MSTEPKITIVGGGPSAIYSWYGCMDAGYFPEEIEIVVANFPEPVGAFFLYEAPIPWAAVPVHSFLLGTCQGYAQKQWGRTDIKTSVDGRFDGGKEHTVVEQLYDPEGLLFTLWGLIPRINRFNFQSAKEIDAYKRKRNAVICTFPDKKIRDEYREGNYLTTFPIYSDVVQSQSYSVVYNGILSVPWVRQTIMPGRLFVEYPTAYTNQDIMAYEENRGRNSWNIRQVPDLTPDCPPLTPEQRTEDNLLRVGRASSFMRGYLSHHARVEVRDFLNSMDKAT